MDRLTSTPVTPSLEAYSLVKQPLYNKRFRILDKKTTPAQKAALENLTKAMKDHKIYLFTINAVQNKDKLFEVLFVANTVRINYDSPKMTYVETQFQLDENKDSVIEHPPEDIEKDLLFISKQLIDSVGGIKGLGQNPCIFGERSFTNGIYLFYKKNLQEYVTGLVQKYPQVKEDSPTFDSYFEIGKAFLTIIQDNKDDTLEGLKKYHSEFIRHFRILHTLRNSVISEQRPHSKVMYQLVDELTLWYYQKVEILPLMKEKLVELFPNEVKHSPKSPYLFVENFYEQTINNTNIGPVCEVTHAAVDAISLGDFPSTAWVYKDGKREIPFIRFPNVAYFEDDLAFQGCKRLLVDPIFKGYIAVNEQPEGLYRHLYFNLMSRHTESNLTGVIEELDRSLANSIDVVSLDTTSEFYWQNPEVYGHLDNDEFKEAFLAHMFQEDKTVMDEIKQIPIKINGSYYWSKKIKDRDAWKERCKHIINVLHWSFFNGLDKLQNIEKWVLIQLVHSAIIFELIEILEPRNCNLSCFSSIDRAEMMLALIKMYHTNQMRKEWTAKRLIKICNILFSPAINILNRPTHFERVRTFLATFDATIIEPSEPVLEEAPKEPIPEAPKEVPKEPQPTSTTPTP